MWWSRTIIVALAALWLAGCGFQPLYGGGRSGPTATELASIRIDPIADRRGQKLRNELLDLLTPYGPAANADYRLRVTLSESQQELAVKKSEVATRANLTISANFQLLDRRTGEQLFQGTSSLVGGYNILDNDFSTLIAEDTAREHVIEQIALNMQARLSAYFKLRENDAGGTTQP